MVLGKKHTVGSSAVSRRLKLLCMLFLVSILTIIVLAYQTAVQTFNAEWKLEGRAYDTREEDKASFIISKAEYALLKTELFTLDSWVVYYLDTLNRHEYRRAIAKIPVDDFERSYWYFKVYFLPRTYGERAEVNKRAQEILPEIARQLSDAPTSKRASKIVADLHYHLVVQYYSDYFLAMAPLLNKTLYQQNYQNVLRAVYDSARTLDPKAFRDYGSDSMSRVVFSSLESAYVYLGNYVFTKGVCNPKIAKQWEEISAKVYEILIKNPVAASAFTRGADARARYSKFSDQFNKEDQHLHELIRNRCR